MNRARNLALLVCMLLMACGGANWDTIHSAVAYGTPEDVQEFLDDGWDPDVYDTVEEAPPLSFTAINRRHGEEIALA